MFQTVTMPVQRTLHGPAWHGQSRFFPHRLSGDVSQMSGKAEDSSEVPSEFGDEFSQSKARQTHYMLRVEGAGTDTGLPQPDPVRLA